MLHLAHGFDSVVIWYPLGVLPDLQSASNNELTFYTLRICNPHQSSYLFAISDDFLSLILFAVEAEYFIDEACILKIHDMWCHHFERFQLFVVEREYLHDADHLGAGIIAAEACHFYQVELVVVEACFLHLII